MGVTNPILMKEGAVSGRVENAALRFPEFNTWVWWTLEHLNGNRASESNFSELGHLYTLMTPKPVSPATCLTPRAQQIQPCFLKIDWPAHRVSVLLFSTGSGHTHLSYKCVLIPFYAPCTVTGLWVIERQSQPLWSLQQTVSWES